jgi:tetratricopeptide (TPR) repeat protein
VQNPFSHGNFRDRSRPFLVVVVILLVLLFVAAFFVKPAWRAIKDRRALKFVDAATAAMAADDTALAAGHLRAAHALSPWHPAVLRATGTHFSRLIRAEGLIYWQQLENSGQMTDADRFAAVRLALAVGDFESARQTILPFATSRPKDPEILRLLAEVFLGFRQLDLAANTLREALDAAPFRPDLEIVLSRVELAQADPRNQRTAKARLWQALSTGGTNQVDAATALLSDARLEPAELRLLDSLLRPGPTASFELHLVKFIVQLRLQSRPPAELAAEFRQATALREDSARFQQMLTALIRAEEHAVVTHFLPLEAVEKYPDCYPLRLEALTGLRDGPGLESTLSTLGDRVGPAQASIYLALAASFAGRTNEIAERWQNAVSRNAKTPPVLKVIAERAEREGERSVAVAAWDALLLQPEYAVQAASQVLRLCLNSTDARPALKAYQQLIRLEPNRQDHRLRLAFLQLLYETDLASARATLAQPPEAPLRNLHAVASALSELREHRTEAAATALEQATVDWPTAPRHWQVVRAAVLAQTGRFSEARLAVAALRPEELSPPEQSLVGTVMKKADR